MLLAIYTYVMGLGGGAKTEGADNSVQRQCGQFTE